MPLGPGKGGNPATTAKREDPLRVDARANSSATSRGRRSKSCCRIAGSGTMRQRFHPGRIKPGENSSFRKAQRQTPAWVLAEPGCQPRRQLLLAAAWASPLRVAWRDACGVEHVCSVVFALATNLIDIVQLRDLTFDRAGIKKLSQAFPVGRTGVLLCFDLVHWQVRPIVADLRIKSFRW